MWCCFKDSELLVKVLIQLKNSSNITTSTTLERNKNKKPPKNETKVLYLIDITSMSYFITKKKQFLCKTSKHQIKISTTDTLVTYRIIIRWRQKQANYHQIPPRLVPILGNSKVQLILLL